MSAPGPARLDIALDRPGRTVGAMRLPLSTHRSAYGQVVIPLVVIRNGAGPTVLLTAGVHGDEYEGQIALMRLARELAPERVQGRIIVVPRAHPAAAAAGLRTSPVDGGNLARLFPGDPAGSITSQIADGITRLLLPEADLVVDLHSGGSSLEYQPCAFGRLPHDPALAERTLAAMLAFGAPVTALMRSPDSRGTLVAEALHRGTVAFATELAGGGGVTPDTVALAKAGVRRVLAHAGVLAAPPNPAPPSRLLVIEPRHFLRAPGAGLFEPAFRLNQDISAGAPAGWLHTPERPDREPELLRFDAPGVVLCRRVPAMVEAGDVLAHLGADITPEALLGAL